MTVFHLTDRGKVCTALYDPRAGKLLIGVNPTFSKVDNKPFRFLGGFESSRQSFNRMGVALDIGLPSDFRARAPKFAAFLKSGVGDNQPIVVKQVCHVMSFDLTKLRQLQ